MSTAAQTGGERRMSRQGSARVRRVGGLGAVRGASPAGHRQRSTGRAPAPAPPLQASSSAPRPRTPSADADADLDLATRSCAAHADEASSKFHERAESTSASAPALPFPPPPPSQPPPPLPILPPPILPPPMETAADLQLEKPSAAVPIRLPSSSLLAPPAEPSPLYSPKKGASPEFSSERLPQTAVHPEGALAFAPKAPEGIVHPEGSDRIVIPYGADVSSSVTTPTSRPATPLSTPGVSAPRVAEGGEDHMAAVRTIADGIHRTRRYRSGHVRRRRGDTYVWSSTHDSSCITCPGGLLENGPPCAVFVWPRPPSTGMRARRALADAACWALAALRLLALLHLWPAEEGLALVEVSPCAPQLPLPGRLHRVRPRPPYRVIEPNWDAAHDDEPRAAAAADAAMDGSGAARPAFRDVDKTLALEAQ